MPMKQYSLSLHGPKGILSTADSGEPQFVIGTEEAADVFTITGEGVAPRHAPDQRAQPQRIPSSPRAPLN